MFGVALAVAPPAAARSLPMHVASDSAARYGAGMGGTSVAVERCERRTALTVVCRVRVDGITDGLLTVEPIDDPTWIPPQGETIVWREWLRVGLRGCRIRVAARYLRPDLVFPVRRGRC